MVRHPRLAHDEVAGGGLVLAALFVLNGSLLQVYTTAMSEPLFIFLSLLALWMFDLYFERDAHWLWLIACGAFVGAAYLTRYAGLAFDRHISCRAVLLHDTWRKRFVSAGIFLAGVAPWIFGWTLRNLIVAGNASNRVLVWHPLTAGNFETTLYTISHSSFRWRIGAVNYLNSCAFYDPHGFDFAGGSDLVMVKAWEYLRHLPSPNVGKKEQGIREVISFTTGLYIFGYIASIVASMLLFDASTKFKLRILAPVFASLLILLVVFAFWLWKKRREMAILLVLVILGLSIYNQILTVQDLSKGDRASLRSIGMTRSDGISADSSQHCDDIHQ